MTKARSPLLNRDRATNILPFSATGNHDIIALDIPYKAMTSAVLDRVLAIPEYDDRPQMGLSRSGLASLVERGGITKDGTKAKSSVLKRAEMKGDRKLTPEIAAKAKKAIAGQSKGGIVVKGQKPISPNEYKFLTGSEKPSESQLKMMNNSDNRMITMIAREIYASGDKQLINKWGRGRARSHGFDNSIQKEILRDHDNFREANNVPSGMSLSNWRKSQSKSQNTPIAPETAKKVKRAIAGVKGGKVTQSPKAKATRKVKAIASQFVTGKSKNHTVFYNGKIVNMDYLGKKPKDEFRAAGQRIEVNLNTGDKSFYGKDGFIKTPKGEYYRVSASNRSAKKVSAKEVLASVR